MSAEGEDHEDKWNPPDGPGVRGDIAFRWIGIWQDIPFRFDQNRSVSRW